MTMNRRAAIGGLLVTGALQGSAAKAAPRGTRLDGLSEPRQLSRLYRQMRFAADGRPFYWWLQGRRYGLIDNVLTPFFDMHVASVHQCFDEPEGRYRVRSAQLAYYTDIVTGRLLTQWNNPITGATVPLTYAAPRASTAKYDAEGGQEAAAPAGTERRHLLGPVSEVGDTVWLREETWIVIPAAAAVSASGGGLPSSQPLRVHDMYTLQSPRAVLRLSGRLPAFVPANGQFNDFNSWSPRFQMGDRPGTSLSRCAGQKERRYSDLPQQFRALAAQVHGDWSRNPTAVLDG